MADRSTCRKFWRGWELISDKHLWLPLTNSDHDADFRVLWMFQVFSSTHLQQFRLFFCFHGFSEAFHGKRCQHWLGSPLFKQARRWGRYVCSMLCRVHCTLLVSSSTIPCGILAFASLSLCTIVTHWWLVGVTSRLMRCTIKHTAYGFEFYRSRGSVIVCGRYLMNTCHICNLSHMLHTCPDVRPNFGIFDACLNGSIVIFVRSSCFGANTPLEDLTLPEIP
jgi:hypothetical protein